MILILGKSPTWEKEVFIDSKPLLEFFWVDSMVGFDVGRIWGGLLKKNGRNMAKSAIF